MELVQQAAETAHDTAPWTATEAIDALTTAALRQHERTGKPLEPAAARRNAIRGFADRLNNYFWA